jgi:hypothetical protein
VQDEMPPSARLVQLALSALVLIGLGGAYAPALGWRDGAFLMLVWALITLAWHLIAGVYAYRHVMAREWPRVDPVEDDDWDD